MRIAVAFAACALSAFGCGSTAAVQSEPWVVGGPVHTRGSVLERSLSARCSGRTVSVHWNSEAPGVTLQIDGTAHWFEANVPFVRDMFAPGTRPASYWMRCRDGDFEIGATIVTAGPEGPVFSVPVVWFTFNGELGGYTGMQVEATEIALRGLD